MVAEAVPEIAQQTFEQDDCDDLDNGDYDEKEWETS